MFLTYLFFRVPTVVEYQTKYFIQNFKDLCQVKTGFKSVPLQFYFEIAGLAGAKKWREIQNMAGEEHFQNRLLPC